MIAVTLESVLDQGGSLHARRTDMYSALAADMTKTADDLVSQFPVVQCTHVWIKKAAFCTSLTKDQVHGIAAMASVKKIDMPFTVRLHSTLDGGVAVPQYKNAQAKNVEAVGMNVSHDCTTVQWGVDTVGAPNLWRHGITGRGVVVGSIDTGANAEHDAIKHNFRRRKGWFNPYAKGGSDNELPVDSHVHGTHTIGTMVGANGIGVAPDAEWIACMGMNSTTGSQLALVQCAQFMMCPTRRDGTHPECKLGADVVNNSWGDDSNEYNGWFEDIVAIWQFVGITPVFSAGNSGPKCATMGNPSRYPNVVAVGSYENDPTQLVFFSSKGPAFKAAAMTNSLPSAGWRGKTDVVAPGFFTVSAHAKDPEGYIALAGTSMASPHVAGVIALLKGKLNDLTYEEIFGLLTTTADRDMLQPEPQEWKLKNGTVIGHGAVNCGDAPDNAWPNHRYGFGRVNAANMVDSDGNLKLNDGGRSPTPAPTVTHEPAPTTTPSKTRVCTAPELNVDIPGQDIYGVEAADSADCCGLCLELEACVGYSHREGVCFLKGTIGERMAKDGAISAQAVE
ncbi:hypothetical protein H310_09481 [Aphanomyces invadans]|uniref:subtilisin n=2 Tax=Aphanomyces invadans TaxID=157072 RepID=A0A024TVC2_9STRA|nr:hypothetical protein H310_09481 [Aphanomyces invadans]ETV97581.1 hypothetical protein H310_09481 [Aphanomyces invadans]|eukprot:XP_008873790.1 hypothetical protein H310_09481 [Aphanomyces invadans]